MTSKIRILRLLSGGVAAALIVSFGPPAVARVHVGIGFGFGFPVYPAPPPVVYWPPPYYYYPPPPPVMYAPPPPPPYYAPRPPYYAPPPYAAPATAPAPPPPAPTAGQDCREYRTKTIIDGKPQETVGTACRQPDGTWRIVR